MVIVSVLVSYCLFSAAFVGGWFRGKGSSMLEV